MTPSTLLHFTAAGLFHAHSEAEAASSQWRPGGECEECPHNNLPAKTEVVTRVERPEDKGLRFSLGDVLKKALP